MLAPRNTAATSHCSMGTALDAPTAQSTRPTTSRSITRELKNQGQGQQLIQPIKCTNPVRPGPLQHMGEWGTRIPCPATASHLLPCHGLEPPRYSRLPPPSLSGCSHRVRRGLGRRGVDVHGYAGALPRQPLLRQHHPATPPLASLPHQLAQPLSGDHVATTLATPPGVASEA